MRNFIGLFILTLAPAAAMDVHFTGKLLGYARECFIETYEPNTHGAYDRKCDSAASSYSTELLALLKAQKKPGDLLLGAGDHFSLDFGARNAILDPKGTGRKLVGREQMFYVPGKGWVFLDEYKGKEPAQGDPNTNIDGDAVANFLKNAGYDALVPGKHDFYFGPERLRQIARLLEASGVRMLASNLVIRAERVKAVATLDAKAKFRSPNFERKHGSLNIKLPDYVLPWMRRVHIDNSASNGVLQFKEARICEAIDLDNHGCGSSKDFVLEQRGLDDFFIKDLAMLRTDVAYHVCLFPPAGRPYCSAFEVERPFFDYNSKPQKPYLVRNGSVVFGVVALGMEGHIGKLNSTWLDPHGEFESHAAGLDPLEALRQSLDYCEEAQECGGRKILLAQMLATSARAINARLKSAVQANEVHRLFVANGGKMDGLKLQADHTTRPPFALTIAEAEGAAHTPFEEVNFGTDYPPLAVSPKPPYQGELKLSVHVQTVSFAADGVHVKGIVANRNLQLPTAAFQTNVGALVAGALQREGLAVLPDTAASFRDLTMAAMRRKENASLVLMQKRDLFEAGLRLGTAMKLWDKVTPNDEIRAAVDGILWKGDYLVRRYLRGSAIKKIMAQSEAFDKLDSDPYYEGDEANRGLAALGVTKDPVTKSYIVDGAPIADDKMYKVATTDYLAFGDTGYPELNQPAVGNGQRAGELRAASSLSDLVYDALLSNKAYGSAAVVKAPHAAKAAPAAAARAIPARPQSTATGGCVQATLVDCLAWTAAPEDPVATLGRQFEGYFERVITPVLAGLPPAVRGFLPNETSVQLRPIWKLSVEKANVSITRYRHNQGDQTTLRQNYDGVAESGVTSPNSSGYGWEWAAELRREWLRSLEFVRVEGVFAMTDTQQKDNSLLTSYAQNSATMEFGWRRAFSPTVRQKPWWGVLVSGVASTQQFNPRSQQSLTYRASSDPACSADTNGNCSKNFDAILARTTRLAMKLGVRGEVRDAWWEAGMFGGGVHRPSEYQLFGFPVCRLTDRTLATCINDDQALPLAAAFQSVQQTTLLKFGPETGMFLNFNWSIPVAPKGRMKIELTNRGRFQFRHATDSQFDTRLSNLFSAAFSMPVAGGLTFKPTWTLFHFMNKPSPAAPETLLMGNTVELKLNYSFDWRTGQSLLKAMRYGNGK